MAEYKVIDNFLPNTQFDKLLYELNQSQLPWYYCRAVNGEGDILGNNMYFEHPIYLNTILNEKTFHIINNLVNLLKIKALIRIKINLYTRTEFLNHHADHIDLRYSHKGAIFSLNTCDGFTVINGEEIPSVANRIILFDPSIAHHSTNCTNQPHRMNININYF
tara:strand:+ start:173 stop:661 length:489 start_codon:yes stop_codon:yes gene_type:complete